jgi:hypothetical protein
MKACGKQGSQNNDLPPSFGPAANQSQSRFGPLPNVGPPEGRVFRAYVTSAGWVRRWEL